jgi:acyl-CoA reductase-like NAD-dependent aldehyde dehydrogenase
MNRAPIPVLNPRTGRVDHAITPLSAAEVAAAAARLRAAQPAWAALGAEGRAAMLMRFAARLGAHAPAIAAALEADTGRRRVSALEVESVVGMLRRWASTAPALIAGAETEGSAAIPGIGWRVSLSPYALVGVISPWNFPLLLALTDAIPALAAGSAVLVKPSEVTPRFIAPLKSALAEVPELSAVLDLVEGDGETGAALAGAVDFIAFTGSVATGRKVGEAAARAFIPASLELGGKDPLIVLAGADPEKAAAIALSASCRATGQACQSIERIYVAAPLFEAFRDALVAQAQAIRPNHPDIASGDLGPFIHAPQALLVQAQIDDAVAAGATLHCGGRLLDLDGGKWLMPTVLTGVTHAMRLMQEETFGPVLPLMPFETEDEAVELANDSAFGLSAAVVAGSLAQAEAVALRLNAGAVSLNDGALTSLLSDAPKSSFGHSGLGPSRAGPEGLLRFLRRRALYRQGGQPLPLSAFSEAG